jgi:hypothetical protein
MTLEGTFLSGAMGTLLYSLYNHTGDVTLDTPRIREHDSAIQEPPT